MKMKPSRLFYLDVIRALSAVLIVVYHFAGSIYLSGRWGSVDVLHGTINGSWGMTPVYCFFMVSGAALMHRYPAGEKLEIKAFYRKRFESIYPLFWIAYCLAFLSVFWRLGHLYDLPSWCLLWSFIGMDGWMVNWVPTFYMVGEWFLGSIIILYLIFPLVHRAWRANKHLVMAVCALAAAALFWYHPFPMDIKQNPVIDLFYFLLGAWLEEMRGRYFVWPGQEKERCRGESLENEGGLRQKAPDSAVDSAKGRAIVAWCLSLCVMAVWFLIPVTGKLPTMELTYSAQAAGLGMFLRQGFIFLCTVSFYVFLMGLSGGMERQGKKGPHLGWIKKVILEISGKSYGVFLTHHVISQMICLHFDCASLSKRETLVLLAMVFLATWVMTLVIYQIWSYIKTRF